LRKGGELHNFLVNLDIKPVYDEEETFNFNSEMFGEINFTQTIQPNNEEDGELDELLKLGVSKEEAIEILKLRREDESSVMKPNVSMNELTSGFSFETNNNNAFSFDMGGVVMDPINEPISINLNNFNFNSEDLFSMTSQNLFENENARDIPIDDFIIERQPSEVLKDITIDTNEIQIVLPNTSSSSSDEDEVPFYIVRFKKIKFDFDTYDYKRLPKTVKVVETLVGLRYYCLQNWAGVMLLQDFSNLSVFFNYYLIYVRSIENTLLKKMGILTWEALKVLLNETWSKKFFTESICELTSNILVKCEQNSHLNLYKYKKCPNKEIAESEISKSNNKSNLSILTKSSGIYIVGRLSKEKSKEILKDLTIKPLTRVHTTFEKELEDLILTLNFKEDPNFFDDL
jgi:hypothetical protein